MTTEFLRSRFLGVGLCHATLLACSPAPPLTGAHSETLDGVVDTGDTGGVTLEADCGDSDRDHEDLIDVSIETTEIPTVLRVRWESRTGMPAHVVFGEDGGVRTPSGGSGDVLLLGLAQDTEFSWQLVLEGPDGPACSSVRTARTGLFPEDWPAVSLDRFAPDQASPGFTIFTQLLVSGESIVQIVDERGEVVWAQGALAQHFRARLSLDRRSILMMDSSVAAGANSQLRYIGLDGIPQRELMLEGAHTDFVELPGGEIAYLEWSLFERDGRQFLGDKITEVSGDGEARVVWRTEDALPLDLSKTWPVGRYVADPTVEDWTHANYLSYDPDAGAYGVSLGGVDGVGSVDRVSGETRWLLTDEAGTEGLEAPQGESGIRPELRFPHSIIQRGTELLVFDHSGSAQDCARAVVYDIEGDSALVRSEHDGGDCHRMTILGDALWLDNGNALVNFSSSSVAEEIDASGELVARLTGDQAGGFGFMSRELSLYSAR